MKRLCYLVIAAGLFAACGPKTVEPDGDKPWKSGEDVVLSSQAEVDEYAAKTRAATEDISVRTLVIRGEDIDDISGIAVSGVGDLTIEGTGLMEISNNWITSVSGKLTIADNPMLVTVGQLMITECGGDIVIRGNPYLDDISFLLMLSRFDGNLTIKDNPMLGEDRPDKPSTWGFNPVLDLLENGILTSRRVTLSGNHPKAATLAMQIGRVAHVARFEPFKGSSDYAFGDGVISAEVLHRYLSRAITEAEYLNSAKYNTDGFYGTDDDKRMLLNIGAKFVGRSMYEWGKENLFIDSNLGWFDESMRKIEDVHRTDPDIIFQAGIFEIATPRVENIPIPWWVFDAFGKKPEKRNFSYDAIRNKNGRRVGQWGTNTCVPDMTNEETQMLYYYKAVRFIEIGIEALHFGQINLTAGMGDAAAEYAGTRKVYDLVREYARINSRRGMVLIDAHCVGHVVGGKHLLDFASYPMRLHEVAGSPDMAAKLEAYYLDSIIGRTNAGTTPSGWHTNRLPYLLEFDNFGTSNHPGSHLDDIFCWGYDEISWITNVSEDYAKTFVTQAVSWLRNNDSMGHLEMPGMRFAAGAKGEIGGPQTYRCNTKSADCPKGRNLEETIRNLWQ